MALFPYPQVATLPGLMNWGQQLIAVLNSLFPEGKTASGSDSSSWASGDLKVSASPSDQAGWLVCDGRVFKKTDLPGLFAAISTRYNTGGEASDEFRIPNADGKVPVQGALANQLLTQAMLPDVALPVTDTGHDHPFTGADHTHVVNQTPHNHTANDKGVGTASPGATPTVIGNANANVTIAVAAAGGVVGNHASNITVRTGGTGTALPKVASFDGTWLIRK